MQSMIPSMFEFSFFFAPFNLFYSLKIGNLPGKGSIHEIIKTLSPLIKSKASKNYDLVFFVFVITSLIISSLFKLKNTTLGIYPVVVYFLFQF